jgi:hypothetical protein
MRILRNSIEDQEIKIIKSSRVKAIQTHVKLGRIQLVFQLDNLSSLVPSRRV